MYLTCPQKDECGAKTAMEWGFVLRASKSGGRFYTPQQDQCGIKAATRWAFFSIQVGSCCSSPLRNEVAGASVFSCTA
ncbi:hypothetical protein CY34DRAFT_688469 [Suillus luteus UH-Slu-Lm8-n1]|uniref:Unplaced genomic scaffold CY34scaffold_75, whole genome shotgun sequence n=1 Tax=Suillus luteus UH-Slu-Lm8-n1 TaxID=930992 RepID=A0A0D0B124_9AGAM|nr:hypothetical protein CY34DRAFT_688469 [Suillus luteus UH-Slu-Lm8-n1]